MNENRWVKRKVDEIDKYVVYDRLTGKLSFDLSDEFRDNIHKCYTSDTFEGNAPFRIYFDFTYKCNLKCIHCITDSSPTIDISKELSFNEICSIIDDLAKIGVFEIQTAGGEPFIHPQWKEIYKYIIDSGMNLIITSNGLLIDNKVIQSLKEINPIEVRVSFDGGEQQHDRIRGKGTYSKAIKSLKLLKLAEINSTARLTLLGDDDAGIHSLFEELCNLHINQVKVALVKPFGRAKFDEAKHLLRSETNVEEVEWLTKLGEQSGLDVQLSSDDFPITVEAANDPKLRYLKRNNCGAGFETAYISPSGDILPCVTIPEIIFGSLRNNLFLESWNSKIAIQYREDISHSKCRKLCASLCSKCK